LSVVLQKHHAPNVWAKLLVYLLHSKTCSQALLKRSTEAVATPEEGERLQLAVRLAEEWGDTRGQHPSTQHFQLMPSLELGCGIPEVEQPTGSCWKSSYLQGSDHTAALNTRQQGPWQGLRISQCQVLRGWIGGL
jgi:hypothetical protein